MNNVLIIGLGGFIGAIIRFLLGGFVQQMTKSSHFPWGTLIVNVAGCFLFGLLAGVLNQKGWLNPTVNSLVFVGFLGAFTTFSTFSNETIALLSNGSSMLGWLNILVSVVAGFGALYLGKMLGGM